MSTLTVATSAQKQALILAIEQFRDQLNDKLGDSCRELEFADDYFFDSKVTDLTTLRQRYTFAKAFATSFRTFPVGPTSYVYLLDDGIETNVVREALESLIDVEGDVEAPSLEEVFSVSNIKHIILTKATSPCVDVDIDVDALAKELNRQVAQTLEFTSPAKDLLASLKY